ncbi:hypothetical protein GCM10011511_11890 [Puia dinghuensis]|uniref:Histidine kinase domain-containing protein n=2 Tax=Puia dinghuensis TaxID=1792502 RepID=A0A8J2UAN5_9BACT|nr:hypothetical protein GCM10011511_11890 [Puia dinghuensis]
MAFDRNGFLWIATHMGLVRFDGRNFREYNMANSPALYSNRVQATIRSKSSGKIIIEPVFPSDRILTVTDDYQLIEDSLLSANARQSHLRSSPLFTYDHLFKRWAAGDTTVFDGLFIRLHLNSDILTVNERQAYARKDEHYYYLDDNTADVQPLSEISGHQLKIQFMVGDVYIFVDRQNRLYAYKAGLLQKITGSPRLMQLLGEVDVIGPYPIQAALRAFRDDNHSFLVHKGDILLLSIINGQLDAETLAANTPIRNVNGLIYDQQNKIIYVGTATSGLYILKKQEFQRLFFSSDNYIINSMYAQVELSDGNILTSSGILNRRNKINIPTPGIYDRPAFLRSSDGHIWYCSYGWLKRTDSNLHEISNITNLGDITYVGIWVTSIVEADNKDILFSTQKKLFRVRGTTATLLLDTRASLQNAEIMTIRQVSSNDLWIGTDAGLFSYNLQHNTVSRVPGLEKATIRAIYKARDGSIWIGTYGQGFYKYVNGCFLRMPMDAVGNLASVHCFLEDKHGNFWLPTNKGLFKVAKSELDSFASGKKKDVFYYYFDKQSGFATNEFNGGCSPCGIVTKDGRFSLPSLDGLVQFDPDSVTIIPPANPIFIDRLSADEKKVLSGDNFKQKQDAGPLVFTVSSPYYGNPVNLYMEYSIPQLDSNWHPVNKDGRLELTGLGHGSYTFTIRKQNGDGTYSYKTVRWTILPYWYETIWFRLLAAVVIISILPLMLWTRYLRQLARARQLEQKVAERTEALSESNRIKEKMIAIILHDLRSPLRFLHMLAVHIFENYQKVPAPELGEMLQKFQNATNDLYGFTQDFVVWTNAQKEGFVVQREKIVLREIVGEIVSLYETGADIRNNTVLNLVPAAITLTSDPHILKTLIRNLTDNANKYTLNGEIKIEAAQHDSVVSISIIDSGRSMEKALVEEILNNTYKTESDTNGFGYHIILELLAKIQGQLLIDAPGITGNRITLLFKTAA